MNNRFRILTRSMLALSMLMFVLAAPAFSQQAKGDSELGLNGSFTIPHSSPGDATGEALVTYGYYFRANDLVGLDTLTVVSKTFQDIFLQGRYRHLFPTGNPKVFPFLGAAGGAEIIHAGGTSADGVGTGEAGLKFFVSQRTAFEVAYNFQYIHVSGQSFSQNSSSVITFGFTHLFGGHH